MYMLDILSRFSFRLDLISFVCFEVNRLEVFYFLFTYSVYTCFSSARQALITDTIPACEYTVYLSAIMPDGKRRHVTKKTIYSSEFRFFEDIG